MRKNSLQKNERAENTKQELAKKNEFTKKISLQKTKTLAYEKNKKQELAKKGAYAKKTRVCNNKNELTKK